MDITTAVAWVTLLFLALLALVIIGLIFTNRIDLSRLISEPNGDASMSRFQLLVFTFVIALSLFLIVASAQPPTFPAEIPGGVLTLLGISASSYLVSKGIQFSKQEGVEDRAPVVTVTPTSAKVAPGGTIQFSATVSRTRNKTVSWGVAPPGIGQINPDTGLYTAPKEVPRGSVAVTIQAASAADATAVGQAVVTITGEAP